MDASTVIIPKEFQGILDAHLEYLSDAVRFVATRVPVQALTNTLDGDDIEYVPREFAEAVIHW